MTDAPPLLAVVGPTASGKTELALALADRLPLEIMVADSRQVYRGMNIGTATPGPAALAVVPHHLLNIADPAERFTVAQWVGRARPLVAEIADRGRLPMLVGGTGLYVSALVDGHDYTAQPLEPARQARLQVELTADGLAPLVARLEALDPARAAAIDTRNPRRVLRALERAEGGGGRPTRTPFPGRVALVALDRPRDVLYRRIDERARRLFVEDDLLEEVRRLLAAGYAPQLRPLSGHGYLEAIGHLAGEWSLEEAIERTARRTRQYAKRQLTWFRGDARVRWIPAGDLAADAPAVVQQAERVLRSALS